MITNFLAQSDNAETFVMPDVEWSLIAPFVILSLGAVILITVTSVAPALKGRGFPALYTMAVAIMACVSLAPIWDSLTATGNTGERFVLDGALAINPYTVFITGIICVTVLLVSMLFDDYLRKEGFDGPEWYVLLMLSAAGGILMVSAEELILLFIGLEILSIAAYVLAGLHLRRASSQEASFKYFALGALASAIFLYGIALTYGAIGSTYVADIASAGTNELGLNPTKESSLILVGMALMLVGFVFKISAVPFHFWAPDVYEGSPTPVVGFMASGIKVAAFAAMVRVFVAGFSPYISDWKPLIAALAVASLLLGSLMALVQTNVKRMLAYSSISHVGFMLIAFYEIGGSEPDLGARALLFYFAAYSLLTIGTFGVLTLLSSNNDSAFTLDDLRCTYKRKPMLAALLAVLLFAQAGIPFTSGFWAKLNVIVAAVDGESYLLAGVAMLSAVVAAVLYLRIVVSVFLKDSVDGEDANVDTSASGLFDIGGYPIAGFLAVVICVVGTLALGVYPTLGDNLVEEAAEIVSITE